MRNTYHEYGHRNRCAANDGRMIPNEIGRHIETALIVQICDGREYGAFLALSTKQLLAAGLRHGSIAIPVVPSVHATALQALLCQIPGLGNLTSTAIQSHCGTHFLVKAKKLE